MKQYQGGHNETWGGVTINIDRNYLDLGQGSVAAPETHCGGTRVDFKNYPRLSGSLDQAAAWRRSQCLLEGAGLPGRPRVRDAHGSLPPAVAVVAAGPRLRVTTTWQRKHWMALLAAGARPVLKFGSAGEAVRRLQRALNAAEHGHVSPSPACSTRRRTLLCEPGSSRQDSR